MSNDYIFPESLVPLPELFNLQIPTIKLFLKKQI